jgi:hypothetical protein
VNRFTQVKKSLDSQLIRQSVPTGYLAVARSDPGRRRYRAARHSLERALRVRLWPRRGERRTWPASAYRWRRRGRASRKRRNAGNDELVASGRRVRRLPALRIGPDWATRPGPRCSLKLTNARLGHGRAAGPAAPASCWAWFPRARGGVPPSELE